MCLLALVLNCGRGGFTLLLHLRDETLSRATRAPSPAAAPLLCGTDAQRGGTWCGAHAGSRIAAAITNVRTTLEAAAPISSSRGALVRALLEGEVGGGPSFASVAAAAALGAAIDLQHVYAPFNLLLVQFCGVDGAGGAEAYLISNVEPARSAADAAPGASAWVRAPELAPGRAARAERLADGVHVVGNVPGLDDTRWGKIAWVHAGIAAAAAYDREYIDADPARLLPASLARYVQPFFHSEPIDPMTLDCRFSSLMPAVELHLQRHVLVPNCAPAAGYGSRTLMVVGCGLERRAGAPLFLAWHELAGLHEPAPASCDTVDIAGRSWSILSA